MSMGFVDGIIVAMLPSMLTTKWTLMNVFEAGCVGHHKKAYFNGLSHSQTCLVGLSAVLFETMMATAREGKKGPRLLAKQRREFKRAMENLGASSDRRSKAASSETVARV
jgi:hypothetical protein